MRLSLTVKRAKQRGITSLFVVIFATLLLSVITMSFAYLMNREFQRSSDDELSQSAYDSAMAGVEDAKRAIMLARSGNTTAQRVINSGDCDTIAQAGVAGEEGAAETLIKSTTDDLGATLNQAYTCVTISMDSRDYVSSVDAMKSTIIPLKGTEDVAAVRIEWHATTGEESKDSCNDSSVAVNLCQLGNWGNSANVPALLRAQTITPEGSSSYADLDSEAAGKTVFLYPKRAGSQAIDMGMFQRFVDATSTDKGAANEPQPVTCSTGVKPDGTPDTAQTYRCQVTLELGDDDIPAGSDTSLLRLTAIYNSTNFRVTMLDDEGNTVDFSGIQPVVDSTGRANDLFRRVEARLSLVSEAAYPEFALDVEGSICKNFYVYEDGQGSLGGTCSPNPRP